MIALFIVHQWLPAGRRRFIEIAPGIVVTLVLWLIARRRVRPLSGRFAYTYVTMYAGLASAMIALVFLYICASIFIYGGELNSVIMQAARTASSAARRFHHVLELLKPARGALTSTAMLPGGCWFFHIFMCASGILSHGNTSLMQGSMRRSSTNWLAARRLLQMREMRALDALLPHPDVARIEGDVVAGGAGAEHHHAAALHDEARHRERLLARMLEHDVDVALAGDVPDRLAELARFLGPVVVFGRVHLRHLAPALEVLAVDDALGAEIEHVVGFRSRRR